MTIQEIIEMWNGCCSDGEGGGDSGGGITWIPVNVVTPGLTWTLGKNFNEIKALIDSGSLVGIILNTNGDGHAPEINQAVGGIYYANDETDEYRVGFDWASGGARYTFYGSSPTDTLTCDISD